MDSMRHQVLLADRYGGNGIEHNGGSGRCAEYDDIQVKGIGKTDLASSKSNHWHAYGGATLSECVREAVWTGVMSKVLPYGAVRVHGIVTLSTSLPRPYHADDEARAESRALLLRTAPLRPAHWMIAPLFNWRARRLTSEADRVKAAVAALDIVAQHYSVGAPFHDLGPGSTICLELTRKLARQSASMLAHRFIHGGLGDSNVAIDGAFLDFGMSSSVPVYSNAIISRRDAQLTRQCEIAFGVVLSLQAAFAKHDDTPKTMPSPQYLSLFFHREYTSALAREIISLLGIPPDWSPNAHREELRDLGKCLVDRLMAGVGEPYKVLSPCDDYQPPVWTKLRRDSFTEFILRCVQRNLLERGSEGSPVPAEPLAERVAAVWEHSVAAANCDQTTAKVIIALNILRRMLEDDGLYAPAFNRELKVFVDAGESNSVDTYIESKIRTALAVHAENTCDCVVHLSGRRYSCSVGQTFPSIDGVAVDMAQFVSELHKEIECETTAA